MFRAIYKPSVKLQAETESSPFLALSPDSLTQPEVGGPSNDEFFWCLGGGRGRDRRKKCGRRRKRKRKKRRDKVKNKRGRRRRGERTFCMRFFNLNCFNEYFENLLPTLRNEEVLGFNKFVIFSLLFFKKSVMSI